MYSYGALPNDPVFSKIHKALLNHSDYQFSLPETHLAKPPEWTLALGRFLAAHWPAIKWGIWIVAGAIVLWVAYLLLRKYVPLLPHLFHRRSPSMETDEEWRPIPAAARELLGESDALAAEGRYGDAVHLLLLRSIEDIEQRRPNLLRPNLTSREIGRLEALPEAARHTFEGIARMVERGLFAGEAIGRADFASCRAAYERFALPEVWGARA
jgi:hypothetical protein